MTIEQEFFEAFGIPIHPCNDCLCAKVKNNKIVCAFNNFDNCNRDREITPEIVLKLMKLVFDATLKKYPKTTGLNFDIKREIKEQILSGCIQLKYEIQDQVRECF